jgi:two-component system, NarL family, sensor histidine kinase UhpB
MTHQRHPIRHIVFVGSRDCCGENSYSPILGIPYRRTPHLEHKLGATPHVREGPEYRLSSKHPSANGTRVPLDEGTAPSRLLSRLSVPDLTSLLTVPLFYKILVTNAMILVVGAGATAFLASQVTSTTHPGNLILVIALFGLVLVVGGMALNAVLIKTALIPLDALEETARLVDGGDLNARVPASSLADRRSVQLANLFNRMLDTQAAIRNRNRSQAARVVEAEEQERNRSSRELHNELAQTLAGVLVRLRVATLNPEMEQAPSLERYLDEIRSEVREALEHVREVARRLHPPALEELGLVPALEAYARSAREVSGARIELLGETVDASLPPEARLAAFRIIQESLIAAIRHSHADRIRIVLRREADMLCAEVVDDGTGFDPTADLENTPMGEALDRILERAAIVGGRVTVESAADQGTRIGIEIPLKEVNVSPSVRSPLPVKERRAKVPL